jgi:NADH-quinone oxidoreductase subunit J
MQILFWLAGAVSVGAAAIALTRRSAVHALLWAVASILSVAVVFVALGAPYVAALEVIVYAGAILVDFVFVVMLLSLGRDDTFGPDARWVAPGTLVLLLAVALWVSQRQATGVAEAVGPREVARTLVGPYLIGVELASLLLLAGLIGAWHLGRGRPRRESEEEES